MEFAIMRINKVHSLAAVSAIERHGKDRERLSHRSRPNNTNNTFSAEKYKGVKLSAAVKDRVKGCKVTKASVLMYEVIFAFSPSAEERIQKREKEWISSNIKWLYSTFGVDNFLRLRVDRDEKTLHIHAFVTPVTKDGRLCAKDFTGGKMKLNALQNTYAEMMRPFGLVRGQNFVEDPQKVTKRHNKTTDDFWRKENEKEFSGVLHASDDLFR